MCARVMSMYKNEIQRERKKQQIQKQVERNRENTTQEQIDIETKKQVE